MPSLILALSLVFAQSAFAEKLFHQPIEKLNIKSEGRQVSVEIEYLSKCGVVDLGVLITPIADETYEVRALARDLRTGETSCSAMTPWPVVKDLGKFPTAARFVSIEN